MAWLSSPKRRVLVALICAAVVLIYKSVLKGSRFKSYAVYVAEWSSVEAYKQLPTVPTSRTSAMQAAPRIPRLLHFISDSELVLNGYQQTLFSCSAVNQHWTVYLWTEADVEALLSQRQPDLLVVYQSLNSTAERLELAKYPVLYHLGGVVLELDVECLKPLTAAAALDFRAAFVAEERAENVMIYDNRLFRLSPAAVGSPPGHSFLAFVIGALVGNVTVEYFTLDRNFLSACYRQWLTSDSRSANDLTVLPSDMFSPSLEDADTMRQLCVQHRRANLSRIYRLRDRGCRMLETANGTAGFTDLTVAEHRHLQPERLWRLQQLLTRGESGQLAARGILDGKFNATKLLHALRFVNNSTVKL